MSEKQAPHIGSCLVGVVIGILLALAVGTVLFVVRFRQVSSLSTPTSLPTSSASPEPAPLDAPSETPTEENPQLAQAESYLEQGRPEMVHDLLWPSMEQWTSDEDKARGYFLLGMAEMDMGHPQLAAPYFERLFQYDPSPENLLYLAVAYDAGGNIGQALDTYKRLAAWDPSGEEIDIELVNQRIQDISLALGTPAPLPASTP